MSRPLPGNQPVPFPDPRAQVREFADLLRKSVTPGSVDRISRRVSELGLLFTDEECLILSALDTPARVQSFLNNWIYYNDDHFSAESVETAMSPRRVLETGRAHCFEGACFAYAVNYLHGHDPRWVLLEGSQDSDHNLILFREQSTGLYGVVAHSAYPHLDGRPAEYATVRQIAESFFPYYYSDISMDTADLTLIGFSDPFDLVTRFGVGWMASDEPLWDMYYTYVDDSIRLRYLFDDADSTHAYPLIRALREGWIAVRGRSVEVNLEALPKPGARLWREFFAEFQPEVTKVPRGRARLLEMQFFALTGTTPLDLLLNAREVESFLQAGYRVEQLFSSL